MNKVRARGKKAGYSRDDYVAAYAVYGSIRKTAKAMGVTHRPVEIALKRTDMQPSKTELYGNIGGQTKTVVKKVPKTGVKRYIVTAAQTETKINEGFWNNLLELARYYGAEVLVAPFAYNKQAFGHQSNSKPGAKRDENELFSAMDPALVPYLVSDRVQLAKGLVFCAEVQILPTATDPLSGLETYTGRSSGIFPHAKIELRSIPSMRDEPTKFNYTTGCVTRHNYIQKKAGQKGEFHHAYGALIVEVMKDGWWVRQLNADKDNIIYDLDVYAAHDDELGATIFSAVGAEALVSGDVHVAELDPEVKEATWGKGGLVDLLAPRVQVLHDVFDMRSRPWQDEQSFHRQLEKHVKKQESVEDEVRECAEVLNELCSKVEKTVIVRSNHDLKLEKWLDVGDYKKDLINAPFFLRAQLAKVNAILRGDKSFKVLQWAITSVATSHQFTALLGKGVQYLAEDESYILCPEAGGGIECGNHGHLGVNGAKGTPKGFTKMARKMIIGDKHVAGIYGGVYVTGTCTGRDVAYAKGPSSWSPTDCVVYRNGKRALVTMWKGRFFAPRP
jgi:hypothetical protein